MEIGNRIHEIRTENNLSQSEFAELFHVSRQAVSNWEHGRNYPDMNTLAMISDKFGISFDELIKEDSELINTIDSKVKVAGRWKQRFITVLIFLLGMITYFVSPFIVKKLYYNPMETVYMVESENYYNGVEEQRMTVDMQVYSTLLMPGHKFDYASCVDQGMGKYAFTLSQSSYFGRSRDVSGQIIRDKLQIFDPNAFKLPYGNSFEWTNGSKNINKSLTENIRIENEEYAKYDDDNGTAVIPNPGESKIYLNELDDAPYYEAYISFNNVMSYQDALKWIDKYLDDELMLPWVAVATAEEIMTGPIGFYPDPSGYIRGFDKEKYPYLLGYEDIESSDFELRNEEKAKLHLTSMLRYYRDQKRFRRIMEWAGYSNMLEYNIDGIDWIADYIDKNGIKVYGVAAVAKKDGLVKIHEDKEVFSISTEEL